MFGEVLPQNLPALYTWGVSAVRLEQWNEDRYMVHWSPDMGVQQTVTTMFSSGHVPTVNTETICQQFG